MGRKKIPTQLKIIKGTHRPWRENADEPILNPEIPDPPKFLEEYAKKEWLSMSKKLHDMGILTVIDKACLAGYCQLYGRWQKAEEDLNKSSLLIKTNNGDIKPNPLIRIAENTYKLMKDSLVEFGMTPASRPKISAKKKEKIKKKDVWADFGNAK